MVDLDGVRRQFCGLLNCASVYTGSSEADVEFLLH